MIKRLIYFKTYYNRSYSAGVVRINTFTVHGNTKHMEIQNIRKSGIYNHDKKINDQFQHVARLGHIMLV